MRPRASWLLLIVVSCTSPRPTPAAAPVTPPPAPTGAPPTELERADVLDQAAGLTILTQGCAGVDAPPDPNALCLVRGGSAPRRIELSQGVRPSSHHAIGAVALDAERIAVTNATIYATYRASTGELIRERPLVDMLVDAGIMRSGGSTLSGGDCKQLKTQEPLHRDHDGGLRMIVYDSCGDPVAYRQTLHLALHTGENGDWWEKLDDDAED